MPVLTQIAASHLTTVCEWRSQLLGRLSFSCAKSAFLAHTEGLESRQIARKSMMTDAPLPLELPW
jgi:hypothetical protein